MPPTTMNSAFASWRAFRIRAKSTSMGATELQSELKRPAMGLPSLGGGHPKTLLNKRKIDIGERLLRAFLDHAYILSAPVGADKLALHFQLACRPFQTWALSEINSLGENGRASP